MLRGKWVPSTETLAGVPCLRLNVRMWDKGPYEKNAFGELGQIGEYNDFILTVITYGRECERRRLVPVKDARYWASKLKVPADPSHQIELAEKFRQNLHYLESHPSANRG